MENSKSFLKPNDEADKKQTLMENLILKIESYVPPGPTVPLGLFKARMPYIMPNLNSPLRVPHSCRVFIQEEREGQAAVREPVIDVNCRAWDITTLNIMGLKNFSSHYFNFEWICMKP